MRRATVLSIVFLLPLVVGLGNELQALDPPQYAEVGRRMYASGDWFHLHDAISPFLNKGPFTFWLMQLGFALLGLTSAAVRLPSLLAAVATVWAVGRLGERLWDRDTGDVARVFTASAVSLHLMVLDPKVDAVLTACITLALLCAVEARTRPAWMYGTWVFGALGFLTKGPLGLFIPVVALLPEVLRSEWSAAEGERPPTLWRRLAALKPLGAVVIVVAMATPWMIALYDEWGWSGPYFILWDQSFGRVIGTSVWKNSAGPLFLAHTALWAYLPATPALAVGLALRARAWLRARGRIPADPRRIVLWWLVVPFFVFSASKMKLPQYAYWMLPAAMLLAARTLVELRESPAGLRWLGRVHAGLGLAVAALVVLLVGWCFPPSGAGRVLWPAAIVGAVGVATLLGRGPALRVATLIAAPIAAFHLYHEVSLFPAMLAYQPERAFGLAAREQGSDGKAIALSTGDNVSRNGLAFWAHRDVVQLSGPEEVATFVREGLVDLAVLRVAELDAFRAAGVQLEPVLERPFFPTSRPNARFMRASTRDSVLDPRVLVRVRPAAQASATPPTPAAPSP